MDIALKQRLVGATVLIALAVVVLPMMLGGGSSGEDGDTQTIALPPQPSELDFETRRYPLGEQPGPEADTRAPVTSGLPTPKHVEIPPRDFVDAGPDEVTEEITQQDPPAETPIPNEGTAPTVSDEPPAVDAVPEPPGGGIPASQNGRFVVQVGSFGSMQNASRLASRLSDAGYSVLSDTIKSSNSTVHRVRVGPYGSKADANQAVVALTEELGGIKPRVIEVSPSNPAAETVASADSDPLARWVVQVGSFSSAPNAENLVARLRLESLSAYQEQVSGSSGTVYRVRVGPFLERDEAIQAEKSIRERLSLDGVVMSAN